MDKAVHAPYFFGGYVLFRVEVFDLARDARLELRCIEARDRPQAGATLDGGLPRSLYVVAERRHGSHTGYHNTACLFCHYFLQGKLLRGYYTTSWKDGALESWKVRRFES